MPAVGSKIHNIYAKPTLVGYARFIPATSSHTHPIRVSKISGSSKIRVSDVRRLPWLTQGALRPPRAWDIHSHTLVINDRPLELSGCPAKDHLALALAAEPDPSVGCWCKGVPDLWALKRKLAVTDFCIHFSEPTPTQSHLMSLGRRRMVCSVTFGLDYPKFR